MQIRVMLVGSLLCLLVASCANQQIKVTPTTAVIILTPTIPTPILNPTFIAEMTGFAPPTRPIINATPVLFDVNTQDIYELINTYYSVSNCISNLMNPQLDQWLNQPVDKPLFLDITDQFNFDDVIVEEIADNLDGKYRAYVLSEPRLECGENCIQSRVVVKDLSTNKILRVDWSGYMIWRFIYGVVWFGENILTFEQSVNPYVTEIVGVDIEKQDYIYHISYWSKDACPLETPNE